MHVKFGKWVPAMPLWLLAAAMLLAVNAGAQDSPPQLINYQGRLLDNQGNPLSGIFDLVFTLWDDPEGGTMLWSEPHYDVSVTDGLFKVDLGAINPVTPDLLASSSTDGFFNVFLEISVDGEEILPRIQLLSAPYSLLSHRVTGDVETSPGNLSITETLGLDHYTVEMSTTGGETSLEMEASDGFALTKAYDKASPLLAQAGMESGEDPSLTKRIDKASPLLYQSLIESSDGVTASRSRDTVSATISSFFDVFTELSSGDSSSVRTAVSGDGAEMNLEAAEGLTLTKVYDKASPLLAQAGMESEEGVSLTKRIDKASPLLYQSLIESSDGVTASRSRDTVSAAISSFFDVFTELSSGDSSSARTAVSGDGAEMSLEAAEGLTLTKVYDKATPILAEMGMESEEDISLTKRIDQASPILYQSLIESSDGLTRSRSSDTLSPLMGSFFDVFTELSSGDSSSARTAVSGEGAQTNLESAYGMTLTKVYDKATPILAEMGMESEEDISLTKRIDQASPILYQSLIESSDGLTRSRSSDTLSPLMGSFFDVFTELSSGDSSSVRTAVNSTGAQMNLEAADATGHTRNEVRATTEEFKEYVVYSHGSLDSVLATSILDDNGAVYSTIWQGLCMPPETCFDSSEMVLYTGSGGSGVSLSSLIESDTIWFGTGTKGPPLEEVSLNMTAAGPGHKCEIEIETLMEEVTFTMTHGGESLPLEEITFSTGSDDEPVGLHILNAPGVPPDDIPADTNVQMYATAEGGSMIVANMGGTAGDGVAITVSDNNNALRMRHGGQDTGIWMEADPVTGGRLGINNEAPSEALQVSGNICATGDIGVCSDIRFKKDIDEIDDALATIERLRGVRFTWRNNEYPKQRFTDRRQIGFVAQEITDVVPEVVMQGADGYYNVDYGKLAPLLVEAIKELNAQNARLAQTVEMLSAKLEDIAGQSR